MIKQFTIFQCCCCTNYLSSKRNFALHHTLSYLLNRATELLFIPAIDRCLDRVVRRPPHSSVRVVDNAVERIRRVTSNLVVAFSGVHPCTPLPMTMKGASVLLLKQLASMARREATLGAQRPRSVPGPTKPAVVRTDPRNTTINAWVHMCAFARELIILPVQEYDLQSVCLFDSYRTHCTFDEIRLKFSFWKALLSSPSSNT